MNFNVLLSSLVFTLSIIFTSAATFVDAGVINFIIAAVITWSIEFVLGKMKDESFEFTSKRNTFINAVYVCIAVVLLLILVALFTVLQSSLLAARIDFIPNYLLLILLMVCCLMSFSIETNEMIHIGRIISYLIIGIMLIIIVNIPYRVLTINLGTISIEEIMKLLPICLSHIILIIYLKFKHIKECVIGNIISTLFLVLMMIFIDSTNLNIHQHATTTLVSSMTLIGVGSLTERIDVFIVCMVLAIEAFQLCIIGSILGKLCITYINQYVMRLIVVTVVVVGLLIGLSPFILEMIFVFSGILVALFSLTI